MVSMKYECMMGARRGGDPKEFKKSRNPKDRKKVQLEYTLYIVLDSRPSLTFDQ